MNGLIEQWGYENYTQDITHITNLFINYNSKNTYTISIGCKGNGQWNYPFTVVNLTNSSFELTSKSDLTNGRAYYRCVGY